jgi:hypothetical protein
MRVCMHGRVRTHAHVGHFVVLSLSLLLCLCVYVWGGWQTTEDELRALFAAYGTVADVSLPTTTDAHGATRVRGFGFVEMSSRAAADAVRPSPTSPPLTGTRARHAHQVFLG